MYYEGVRSLLLFSAAAATLAYACGGGSGASDGGEDAAPDVVTQQDAGIDVVEAAAPDVGIDNYIAPLPVWQVTPLFDYVGGHLLTSVKVITVSFSSDDAALITRVQELDDTITQSAWWTAATSEYCELPSGPCIGPGTPAGHVVLTETAPTSLIDNDDGTGSTVVSFIQDHITSGLFPPPDDQTIYVIYFPSGTSIQYDGDHSCSSFGAYHYSATFNLPDGGTQEGSYAIEPRCSGEPYITFAASHELIEAATDARPGKLQGWVMEDLAWQYYGDEVGDICDHYWSFESTVTDSMYIDTIDGGAPFQVQRGWSNLSALAGHDPCVIPPSNPYFNTAPGQSQQNVYLSVGESTTVQFTGFSDGPMPDWTISAIDMGSHYGSGNVLTLSLDTTTMNSGQVANLTITLNSEPTITDVAYVIDSKGTYTPDGGSPITAEHQWGANVYLK